MSSTRTPAPPPPVCVAGMHRSGTSMVTKLLHQSGLHLGDPADLAEPGLHNPDGYWENLRFVEINDDLLNHSGGGWDLLPPESRRNARRRAGRTASASAAAAAAAAGTDPPATLRARATTLVARFPADAPWGWKDPRNSLTLPFWKAVCPAVRVVVCVRNPLEVALSLHQRNDFSYAHGLALWAGYNRRLLRATTPSRRLVTHYDAFFTDPAAEVRRLADFARLRPSEAVVLAAAAGVRPELRHNRFTAADLLDARVSDEVLDLYARLCEEAARPEPVLREYAAARLAGKGRRQSGASVATAAEASGEVHVDRRALEAELMRRELAALRPELRRRDALAQDLQARLDQAARRVAELEVAVTQGRADLARAAADLAARDAALRESELALRENDAALRRRDASLRNLQSQLEKADRRAARAERRAETAEATAAALAAAADSSRDAAYKLTVRQLRDVVRAVVPADATVLVVSRGDDEMLRLDGRAAWHFPREAGGAYAGHYPADSGEAIGHLESLRAAGADYLVLPDTALWWLDHYFDFRRHLETRCRAVARVDGACRVYALDPAAAGAAPSRQEPAAPASRHAAPAADARTAADGAAGGSKEGRYRQLLGRVREAVDRVAPAGSTVLVVSKGDERVAELGGRRAWHFPRDERGVYAGYHPADSTAAINHLEALRSKGAQFLLLPSTAFWWLEHYGAFRRHLDARYARVWSDADCVVYRLAADGAATARAESDAGSDARVFTPAPLDEAPPPPADRPSVDVVVCVHDALDDVKRCLDSVVRHTRMPHALVLVDDGSGDETRRYLESFARAQGATLLRSDAAGGYTAAANRGLRHSRAPYVLLLNSDTIVGPEWLDRLVACAESDPAIGLVGPLSNTASWQSVPSVLQGGDWSRNALPPGVTPAGMARRVAADSGRVYPRVPFLNGFCLMVRREVLRDLGEFDEATFAGGYGEENDYCLRAGKAGWELAVADDVYVFHRQSASYSDERRRKLCERADAALEAKHGRPLIDAGVAACRFGRVLEGVRARSAVAEERRRLLEDGRARWEGRRVLFVLPVAEANGGGNVVLQEAAAMQRMGVDVRVLNLEGNRAGFEQGYPDNALPVLYARNEGDVARLARGYDAIVATWSGSVDWLGGGDGEARHAASGHGTGNGHRNGNGNGNGDRNGHRPSVRPPGGPVRGYYVQDFEPEFYTRGSDAFRSAFASYTRYGDLVRFTKTDWNRDAVRRQTGADCAVVGPSVDVDLHRPRRRRDGDWPARPARVAAMVRPATPRRAPRLTMAVLAELKRKWGAGVEIIVFGCAPDDPGLAALPQDFSFRRAGTLTRRRTASLLNEVDVFADFSAFQAMGLTALEAMACGAAVVVPKEGGAGSFARDGENALVVDTASQDACLAAADRLVGEADLRARLQRQAIHDACHHHPERAAFRILEALLPAGAVSTGSALTPEAPADA